MVEKRKLLPAASSGDRISKLTNQLIHHILSFIDTKYAVQTCVLSKRWINIWKSLPFLNFNRNTFSRDKTKRFIEFVYMVFLHRDNTNIVKFNLEWAKSAYDNTVLMNVNIWSFHAVKYNVQEIAIVIGECHDSAYEIHHHVLNCNSLKKLEILMLGWGSKCVDTILPKSMNLPKLEELGLYGLSIVGVEKLFSSCPILAKLQIQGCNVRNLVIDSLSLKDFEYHNDNMNNILKLSSPNLEDFIFNSFLAQDYSLENCSSISRVSFDMMLKEEDENAKIYEELPLKDKDLYARRMMKFLEAVHMVKGMQLSSGSLEVLSQVPDILGFRPPFLCNLQQLWLKMWSTRGCLRAIAYLLSISPNITKVFLDCEESHTTDVGDDWEAGLSSPGMLSNLKYVRVRQLEGCDAELKLMRFLLKNAKDLETVAISFRSIGSIVRLIHVEQFKNKLREFPTASSNITWGLLVT